MTQTVKYQRKPAVSTKKFWALKIFNFCSFVLAFTLIFFYLIGISDLTAKSFVLQDLRTRSANLAEEQEFYEQQVNSLQSFYVLNEKVKTLNMVKIEDIEYLKAGDQAVAKK